MKFFSSHLIYSKIPAEYLGCEALVKKLTHVLFTHIQHNMPEIVNEIREKLKECEYELKTLGNPLPTSKSEKLQIIWAMITEFVESFKN